MAKKCTTLLRQSCFVQTDRVEINHVAGEADSDYTCFLL